MITDTIGNYLTSIRNAILAEHKVVRVPASKVKKADPEQVGAPIDQVFSEPSPEVLKATGYKYPCPFN